MAAPSSSNPFASLRRFVREDPGGAPVERCELCSVALAPVHRHLMEPASRQILCACDACACLFAGDADRRFKLIPRDARVLSGFRLDDGTWHSLALPINLAFFFYSTPAARIVAMYPGPAGATESLLPLTAWDTLVDENPALAQLSPDVEALLVNRVGARRAYFLAPIDRCYELVGLIRLHWRGLSGGARVWEEIDGFFARMEEGTRRTASPAPAPRGR